MADENQPLENAEDAAKKAAAAGAKSWKNLTGLKPVAKPGAVAPKPVEAADAAAAAPTPVVSKPVAPGAGIKPGAGLKPVAPGAGIKPVAPGAGIKPAAPAAPAAAAPVAAKPAAPAAPAATSAPKAAAVKKEEAPPPPEPSSVSRREFLNYVWGASMTLFLAQFGGLTYLFSFPRFRPGQFGGKIPASVADIPELNKPPKANDVGKFWLVNTDDGVNVLYKICTHLGCIYPWSDAAGIFACPCHGSQFQLGGKYIAGPAPRDLDKFAFEVLDAGGNVLASVDNGLPVKLPAGATTILVNTGLKVSGNSHF